MDLPRAALRFTVTRAQIHAYAAAINDDISEHRSGEVAPPLFAAVAAWPALMDALESVAPQRAVRTAVHYRHDLTTYRRMRTGEVVETTASATGLQPMPGGTVVWCHGITTDEHGYTIAEQWFAPFVRGVVHPRRCGHCSDAPDDDVEDDAPLAVVVERVDLDHPARYAAATGDDAEIHLDDGFARSVGLPGVVLQGLCVAAIATNCAIRSLAGGDASLLRRVAVRFDAPVLPGQEFTLRFSRGARDGCFRFTARTGEGRLALSHGLVEVGPATATAARSD